MPTDLAEDRAFLALVAILVCVDALNGEIGRDKLFVLSILAAPMHGLLSEVAIFGSVVLTVSSE